MSSAFKVALTTSDLAIVTYLCQKISPSDVFPSNGNTSLSQPVILSLIQVFIAYQNVTNENSVIFSYTSLLTIILNDNSISPLSQQLSANLMEHTDLKLDYLSEALMALDDSTQVTADHLGTLLPILVQNLQVSHGAFMLVLSMLRCLLCNIRCQRFMPLKC